VNLKRVILIFILLHVFASFGQNLLNNGTFEYGGPGLGFWIDGQGYIQLNPPYSGNTSAGNFAFVTNPQSINNLNFVSSGDHTSGSGKMMVVDGTNVIGQQRFWKAGDNGGGICNLTVGVVYRFSYWIRTVSNTISGNSELADIGISINNASNISLTFGTTLAPIQNFGWQEVRYTFTATNSCVNIELFNNNTNPIGNDFAIDDVQLVQNSVPLGFTYSVTQPNCEDPNSGLIVIYPLGGTPPYLFRIIGPQPIPITNNTGVFQFVEPGTYTIGLMDANGTIDSIQNIIVNSISNLVVTPHDTVICPGNSITLDVTGGNGSYTWTSNNPIESGFPSSLNSISVNPTLNTIYEVSSSVNNSNLIYNGDFQLGNQGFETDYSYYFPSNPSGAQRTYGVLANPTNWYTGFPSCIDHTIGNGTGKMMVIDGSTFNIGNDPLWCQLVAVEPNKNYLFSYWSTSLSSSNSATIQVRINGVPIGSSPTPSQNCSWNEVSYIWNSGNNLTAEICLYDLIYAGIGNDFAIDDISLRSQNYCSEQVQVTMANIDPDYGVTYPYTGCLNDSIINPLFSSNFISGGVFNSIQSGLNLNPITGEIFTQNSNEGFYEITYTASVCGNFVPDTFNFVLKSPPNFVSFNGGTYNCESHEFNPVILTVTGAPNFQLFYTINDNILSSYSNSNQINLGNTAGIYTLDSISDLYCSNSIEGTLTIDPSFAPIKPIIQGDSIYCYNSSIQPLTVINATDGIRWYGNSELTEFLGSNIELLPNNQVSQTYYATQTINGCEGEADSLSITINACQITIPSAFTPNSDGDNDFWNIHNLDEQYPENIVSVFNRWGELIYESTVGNYENNRWDGRFNGTMMPVGTYYYVIQLTKDKTIEPLNGIVTLILKK
jgi:gliding motility-associated-like protein